MEKYYFRKYKEWIKEIRGKKNLKYTPDIWTWVLLIAFIVLVVAVTVSMLFIAKTSGKVWFLIFLSLLAVTTAIMVRYDGKRLIKDAFSGFSVFKGVCDELIKKFQSDFGVTKTEHFESILKEVVEERDRLREELDKPRQKTGKLMIAVFVPVLIALVKEYFSAVSDAVENNVSPWGLMDKNVIAIAIGSLAIFFLVWVGTVIYSKSMNRTFSDYDEFIGYLREIVNIKKGFYSKEKADESKGKSKQ